MTTLAAYMLLLATVSLLTGCLAVCAEVYFSPIEKFQ